MKAILLSLFILIASFCEAQKPAFLLKKLKAAQSDTQKINTLNALTKLYIDINIDSAIIYNKQSIFLVSNSVNKKYSYKAIAYKAQLFRKKKNLDSALIVANNAYDIAKKHNISVDTISEDNISVNNSSVDHTYGCRQYECQQYKCCQYEC